MTRRVSTSRGSDVEKLSFSICPIPYPPNLPKHPARAKKTTLKTQDCIERKEKGVLGRRQAPSAEKQMRTPDESQCTQCPAVGAGRVEDKPVLGYPAVYSRGIFFLLTPTEAKDNRQLLSKEVTLYIIQTSRHHTERSPRRLKYENTAAESGQRYRLCRDTEGARRTKRKESGRGFSGMSGGWGPGLWAQEMSGAQASTGPHVFKHLLSLNTSVNQTLDTRPKGLKSLRDFQEAKKTKRNWGVREGVKISASDTESHSNSTTKRWRRVSLNPHS